MIVDFWQKTLRQVLDECASASPTPGGGSVAALAACLGISMSIMVCEITASKKTGGGFEERAEELALEARKLMSGLEELLEADMEQFNQYMSALKLPKETEEEKTVRAAAMREALKGATEVPLEIARTCLAGLELNTEVSRIGKKSALSDAGVAALLLEAALHAALLNVDANVPFLDDREFAAAAALERHRIAKEAENLKDRALDIVRQRMS